MRSGENWNDNTAEEAQRAIGYVFRDKKLLLACFTHTSYSNLSGEPNNERLEFLGDAVLELCVSEALFSRSDADEGALTELRKQYVSKHALEEAEAKAGLMKFLRFSGGESNVGGKTASNLFEAVTAGVYLDGGLKEAKKFLYRFLTETDTENYKSLLQELTQGRGKKIPVYKSREENGGFVCRVSALGKTASGKGVSKKAAETQAAKLLYQKLKGENA